MVDAPQARIVLLGGSSELRLARSAALTQWGAIVCDIDSLSLQALPGESTPVLVVIDPIVEEPQLQLSHLAGTITAAIPDGGLAVIQIGPVLKGVSAEPPSFPPAEVELASDATPRELVLACRLVAQIVRLRRDNRQAVVTTERFHELAHRDPLTGLLNRRAWDTALANRLGSSITSGGLCVALIDLDHFKGINDQFGHAAGDAVLKAAADVLSAELRGADVVARLGGDEFGVLIADVDRAAAAAVIDRLLAALRQRLSAVAPRCVTASIGYRHVGGDQLTSAFDPAVCWRGVDEALREAKRQGRDRANGV